MAAAPRTHRFTIPTPRSLDPLPPLRSPLATIHEGDAAALHEPDRKHVTLQAGDGHTCAFLPVGKPLVARATMTLSRVLVAPVPPPPAHVLRGAPLVLKRMHPRANRRRGRRKRRHNAQALTELQLLTDPALLPPHPNVMSAVAGGLAADDTVCAVMPQAAGTLLDLLAIQDVPLQPLPALRAVVAVPPSHAFLPLRAQWAIARQLAAGAAHLAAAGLVHHDLKFENVLVYDGARRPNDYRTPLALPPPTAPDRIRVVLTDFGGVVPAGARDAPMVFTPYTAAPAVVAASGGWKARGRGRPLGAAPASDVWSLGVMLCILHTGMHPLRHVVAGVGKVLRSTMLLELGNAGMGTRALHPLLPATCSCGGPSAGCGLMQLIASMVAPTAGDRPTMAAVHATLSSLWAGVGVTVPCRPTVLHAPLAWDAAPWRDHARAAAAALRAWEERGGAPAPLDPWPNTRVQGAQVFGPGRIAVVTDEPPGVVYWDQACNVVAHVWGRGAALWERRNDGHYARRVLAWPVRPGSTTATRVTDGPRKYCQAWPACSMCTGGRTCADAVCAHALLRRMAGAVEFLVPAWNDAAWTPVAAGEGGKKRKRPSTCTPRNARARPPLSWAVACTGDVVVVGGHAGDLHVVLPLSCRVAARPRRHSAPIHTPRFLRSLREAVRSDASVQSAVGPFANMYIVSVDPVRAGQRPSAAPIRMPAVLPAPVEGTRVASMARSVLRSVAEVRVGAV